MILSLLLPLAIVAEEVSYVATPAEVEADRPGTGTGPTVLERGVIQWETGFEAQHYLGLHAITLPATTFRFGLDKRAELRLEYAGALGFFDHSDTISLPDRQFYAPTPLYIGSKILLWEGSDERHLKWIPKISLMAEIGLPLTTEMAKRMPIAGNIDLLFENEITNWFSISYDFGAYWVEWAPMPDFFASLSLNFMPTDKLGLFVENYNSFDCDLDPAVLGYSTVHMVYLDFGLTYLVHPRVQLDLYSGFNCYHTEPILRGPKNDVYLGLGVAWRIR